MRRIIFFSISLFLILFFLIPSQAHAEEFALTKIGAMQVNGKYYTHWWYEPTKLTLEGTGSRGANIDVYVDGNVTTIKVSETDGTWKYSHEKELEKKDHNITVSSGGKDISFILTIGAGSVPPETQDGQPKTLPETGNIVSVIGIVLLAGAMIYYGFRERLV